jgi:hypothetical protein
MQYCFGSDREQTFCLFRCGVDICFYILDSLTTGRRGQAGAILGPCSAEQTSLGRNPCPPKPHGVGRRI